MSKKGLTLLEILIAVLIFSITIVGFANLFISGKRYILHARDRMSGGELGKFFLDPLHMQVRQDLWSAGTQCITGDLTSCPQTQTINNTDYDSTYNISDLLPDAQNPLGRLRKVRVNLTWTE